MSRSEALRRQREGTIINTTSKQQESLVILALRAVVKRLTAEFGVVLHHEKRWKLTEVVRKLREHFPDVPFFTISTTPQ
jgi:hypothetical protein